MRSKQFRLKSGLGLVTLISYSWIISISHVNLLVSFFLFFVGIFNLHAASLNFPHIEWWWRTDGSLHYVFPWISVFVSLSSATGDESMWSFHVDLPITISFSRFIIEAYISFQHTYCDLYWAIKEDQILSILFESVSSVSSRKSLNIFISTHFSLIHFEEHVPLQ